MNLRRIDLAQHRKFYQDPFCVDATLIFPRDIMPAIEAVQDDRTLTILRDEIQIDENRLRETGAKSSNLTHAAEERTY